MNLEVRLRKDGAYWLIEAPALDVMTEGKTRKEAYGMLAEAVELLVDTDGFRVVVASVKGNTYLTANDEEALIALLLRRQRQKAGLTLQEVAKRLGAKSLNAFARYEQGRSHPTVAKLSELIEAINPDLAPTLILG